MKKGNILKAGLALTIILSAVGVYSCRKEDEGEKLAKIYCASCHMFPEPALLDKSTWANSVLPQMAFRMGFPSNEIMSRIASSELKEVLQTIPDEPMMTENQLIAIRNYYFKSAPDSIIGDDRVISDSITLFKAYRAPAEIPLITVIKFDSANQKVYVGNRSNQLYRLNAKLEIEKSMHVNSPVTHIELGPGNEMAASLIGIVLPNDQRKGELIGLDRDLTRSVRYADSIRRPVYVEQSDLNLDGKNDYVVSAFGHYKGQLKLYASKDGGFEESNLSPLPGARKTVIRDFNGDGRKDVLALMTQGDERIVLFENNGDLKFTEKTLLRFPPVYGSAYFDLVDFNGDGHLDLLYANGDNGDFSIILKPYHGIKLFMNDGTYHFTETWSFPMQGAQEARAADFDNDGDLDIAAISYFPDFENHPERSLIYFNNLGDNKFQPQVMKMATTGRWLIMETGDFDRDNDIDILLGSMSVKGLGATEELYKVWFEAGNSILVLENTLNR